MTVKIHYIGDADLEYVHYIGDADLEYGGYFYTKHHLRDGYAYVLRVTPASDWDAQENAFLIEFLAVNLPTDPKVIQEVMETCGGESLLKGEDGKVILMDASLYYGLYDQIRQEIVQIGKEPDGGRSPISPHRIINAKWKLKNWIKLNWFHELRG